MSEHINLARLKKGDDHFEIDIDPEKAMEFKAGKLEDIKEVLKVENVFSDAKKGMLASEKAMETHFDTSDPLEVATIIVKTGEIQLNDAYRKNVREQKLKQLINIIHRNGVDPATKLPHPETRIENAIAEAKVHLDEYKPADQQVPDVLKKLRPILPIKFVMKELAVTVPAEYGAKSYNVLKTAGKVMREEWLQNGSLSMVIEIPGGLEQEFYEKLNAITHGNNTCEVVKVKE